MISFDKFIIESKNTHMQHLEDLIFHEGVKGTKRALDFLRDLRDMLAGHSKDHIARTVKWDGAPAVFIGIDPSDGKFFVAKKGIFNKNPKVYKSVEDVKADTAGDLQKKLIIAFEEFSKLGIKKGVYQGDIMFTSGDVKLESIDGEKYYTFHPNTILYAVPFNNLEGKRIANARIGVVWHTTYTGKSFESMSASFGKDISKKFKKPSTVWQMDATYKDVTGTATFTADETKEVTAILSQIGKLFNAVPADLINEFSVNDELRSRTMIYNNTHVRAGASVNPKTHVSGLMNYMHEFYQAEINNKKTQKSKDEWIEKKKNAMKIFVKFNRTQLENLFELLNAMVTAKEMIINKMNKAGHIGAFLRTSSGFKATSPEGFVAIDHLSNSAVKLVNRLEFSRANFSSDVIKGWQR